MLPETSGHLARARGQGGELETLTKNKTKLSKTKQNISALRNRFKNIRSSILTNATSLNRLEADTFYHVQASCTKTSKKLHSLQKN